jgi:indolepyruvate ferredoxin oxidoreductase beta subunit
MVLLGALIQTGMMPVSADNVKDAIRTSTKKAFVDINIKAFELGFEAATKAA